MEPTKLKTVRNLVEMLNDRWNEYRNICIVKEKKIKKENGVEEVMKVVVDREKEKIR